MKLLMLSFDRRSRVSDAINSMRTRRRVSTGARCASASCHTFKSRLDLECTRGGAQCALQQLRPRPFACTKSRSLQHPRESFRSRQGESAHGGNLRRKARKLQPLPRIQKYTTSQNSQRCTDQDQERFGPERDLI